MISRSLALPLGISHLPKGILEVIFLNAPIYSRRFLCLRYILLVAISDPTPIFNPDNFLFLAAVFRCSQI